MKKKIIWISLIFVMFMFVFTSTLHAADLGTINFVAINSSSSEAIGNLEVSIYKVTGADEDGNFIMEIGFENCEIDIDDLSEENLEELKTFAKLNAEPMFTKTTDSDGKFTLENLGLGRYLLIQENQTEDIKMQTMLIMLPELTVENGLRYEITAKPKINEVIPETPDTPLEDELPATGTLHWLVPVFAIAGLVIFCIAWLKVYTTSKKKVN